MTEQMDDDAVEQLLSGTPQGDDLGRLLGAIKAEFDAIEAPPQSAELRAFIDDAAGAVGGSSAPTDELLVARRRRRRGIAIAATGTTLGKLMIGMSAAAASIAGMQVAGLVDVPSLPGRIALPESVVTDDSNQAPPTTIPASTTREPTDAADDVYRFDAVEVGTVSIGVTEAKLVSVSVHAAPDWQSQVNRADTAADIAFNHEDEKIDVRAMLDGELLHVMISDHRTGTTTEFWIDRDNNVVDPEGGRADDNSDLTDSDDNTPATQDDSSESDPSGDGSSHDDTPDSDDAHVDSDDDSDHDSDSSSNSSDDDSDSDDDSPNDSSDDDSDSSSNSSDDDSDSDSDDSDSDDSPNDRSDDDSDSSSNASDDESSDDDSDSSSNSSDEDSSD